jgi:hypothetical protein
MWALGVAALAVGIGFVLVGIDPLWALPIILCLGIALLGGVELWELRKARHDAAVEPRSEDQLRQLAR